MAYKSKIMWRFSGYEDQKSAEAGLEATENWFKSSFDYKSYVTSSSVQGTPMGWTAEFIAEKSDG